MFSPINNILVFLNVIFFLFKIFFCPYGIGGSIGNNRNALCGAAHPSCAGSFPKHKDYEYQHLSKESEIRLRFFFNHTVEPEQLAKALRQVNFILALETMREDKTLQHEIIKLETSFYWLNELAEILNPYLDVE
ncbi:hypothetical protein [Flavobacterium sp. CSZ]|uniref:hypothetical protein n=1 Tax=Flavobacterium sp. CSZ TaxID=2783791 RepID=UPI003221BF5C